MIKISILIILPLLFLFSCSSSNKLPKDFTGHRVVLSVKKQALANKILIITDSGNMVARLYDSTPLHRDNFKAKIKTGFYDGLLFHRVIKKFMIQGGDPTSKSAAVGQALGDGEAPGGKIPAEIFPNIYHKKGALGMARDGNPEKASSNCQFYIVEGRVFTNEALDSAAEKRHYTLDSAQRKIYTTIGGTPHLDKNYTVFGEVEYGLDVVDKIAFVPTSKTDRPLGDVRMKIYLFNKKGKILKKRKK